MTDSVAPFLIVEGWAKQNANLLFVPQATEEARDFVHRRNFKPSGGFFLHSAEAYRRRAGSRTHPALGSPK